MGWYIALLIKDCRYFCCSSFGLSIKSIHEIEWSKVTRWNGTKEFSKKSRVFGTKWQVFFNLLTFNFKADIINRYTFNQARWFHILMGYTSKIHEK